MRLDLELPLEYWGGIWGHKKDWFLMNSGESHWQLTNNRAWVTFPYNRKTCADPRKSFSFIAMSIIINYIATFKNLTLKSSISASWRMTDTAKASWGYNDTTLKHAKVRALNSALDLIAKGLCGLTCSKELRTQLKTQRRVCIKAVLPSSCI